MPQFLNVATGEYVLSNTEPLPDGYAGFIPVPPRPGYPCTYDEDAGEWVADESLILNQLIGQIKQEASRRILDLYPGWKQLNMNAEATYLQEIRLGGGTLTNEQEDRRTALMADWAVIAAIRTRSDELETSLDGKSLEELIDFIPTDPDHWD